MQRSKNTCLFTAEFLHYILHTQLKVELKLKTHDRTLFTKLAAQSSRLVVHTSSIQSFYNTLCHYSANSFLYCTLFTLFSFLILLTTAHQLLIRAEESDVALAHDSPFQLKKFLTINLHLYNRICIVYKQFSL